MNRTPTGHVDSITAADVTGWVLKTNAATGFPVPQLYVNGKPVAPFRLTGPRDDVMRVHGVDAVGIYVKLARHLVEGRNEVEVVFPETGSLLGNGRKILTYDRDALAGTHWSKEYADGRNLTIRWWQSDHVVEAINERICGRRVAGLSRGLYVAIQNAYPGILPARRGVSVGAGYGVKEMDAIEAGLADTFDLYEVSAYAVDRGRALAKQRGMEARVTFHLANAFTALDAHDMYDLVFWNNALHHMSDAREAVRWSHRVLKPGGLYVMDDYVGPTRMQFPDAMLRISDEFRDTLPDRFFVSPYDPGQMLPRACARPDEDDLIAMDPSECADSGNILPALRDEFPGLTVQMTGGGVYHLGLSDVLHNIVAAGDTAALDRAMDFDDRCRAEGLTQYAVAYGRK